MVPHNASDQQGYKNIAVCCSSALRQMGEKFCILVCVNDWHTDGQIFYPKNYLSPTLLE